LSFDSQARAIRAVLKVHSLQSSFITDAGLALLIEQIHGQHRERHQRLLSLEVAEAVEAADDELTGAA
jgi:hypothetical protein